MTATPPASSGQTPYSRLSLEERRQRSLQQAERGETDVSRWADARNLAQEWDSRAELVASLVVPPARLIDLGCGAMALERALPDGITYIPADVVARDGRTKVFDINRGDLPDVAADVAVALGLLEYVHQPERLFEASAKRWPRLILSYHPVDVPGAGSNRLAKGWFTDLRTEEVLMLASDSGFEVAGEYKFKNDRIFDFRHRS